MTTSIGSVTSPKETPYFNTTESGQQSRIGALAYKIIFDSCLVYAGMIYAGGILYGMNDHQCRVSPDECSYTLRFASYILLSSGGILGAICHLIHGPEING